MVRAQLWLMLYPYLYYSIKLSFPTASKYQTKNTTTWKGTRGKCCFETIPQHLHWHLVGAISL
jgi:hypothetical protein